MGIYSFWQSFTSRDCFTLRDHKPKRFGNECFSASLAAKHQSTQMLLTCLWSCLFAPLRQCPCESYIWHVVEHLWSRDTCPWRPHQPKTCSPLAGTRPGGSSGTHRCMPQTYPGWRTTGRKEWCGFGSFQKKLGRCYSSNIASINTGFYVCSQVNKWHCCILRNVNCKYDPVGV